MQKIGGFNMVSLLNGNWNTKELIFFGTGSLANRMERIYQSYGYEVKYYCYTSAKGNNAEQYKGKTVFSVDELIQYCNRNHDTVIQIASSYENEIMDMLKEKNINATILIQNDFHFFINSKKLDYLNKKNPSYRTMAIKDSANCRKYFARNLAWEQLDYYNLEKDVINIILSSPKTGSTTIFESCMASQDIIDPVYISYTMKPFSKEYFDVLSGCQKRFISGIREPISQIISMFFYLWYTRNYMFDSLDLFPDHTDCQYWFNEHFAKEDKIDNAFEIFCEVMEFSSGEIDFYEKDYSIMTGIDLLQYPFDKEKGYSIIKENNSEILVYRLDKLNELESTVGKYFGAKDFSLINSNCSDDRIYKSLYKKACDSIRMKRSFIESIYNKKLVQWCYTEEEIEGFWKKWKDNIID